MTGRSTVRQGRAGRPRPAERLGLWKVPLIAGESTGSFARRLAALNGIPDRDFWLMFGRSVRPGREPSEPRYGDGFLNTAALERLSVMCGRSVGELQFALPNTRPHRLLKGAGPPAWDWPWDTPGCFLVRGCELCARVQGTTDQVYLAVDASWQVCARHGRWLDNRREPGAGAIRLAGLPEVVHAERKRRVLERRLGPGGRAMFADAYAITSCWWNVPVFNPAVWQARRRLLRAAGRDELRVAPLLFYPEAVALAYELASRERRRQRRTLSPGQDSAWLAGLATLMDAWGMPAPALDVVGAWLERHTLLPRPRSRAAREQAGRERPTRGRYRRLPLPAPHKVTSQDAVLAERSCLPWKLGELITNRLQPAPRGWYLGGRA